MAVADQAYNLLFAMVRDFSVQTPDWGRAVRYQTKPDERLDLTLVSQRVYGSRSHALVIQAAAGLDSPENEMDERLLVLPAADQLLEMRRRAGFPDVGLL